MPSCLVSRNNKQNKIIINKINNKNFNNNNNNQNFNNKKNFVFRHRRNANSNNINNLKLNDSIQIAVSKF